MTLTLVAWAFLSVTLAWVFSALKRRDREREQILRRLQTGGRHGR